MDIEFIGWCYEPESNHDKVWGIGSSSRNEYTTFWGRRGYTLQTKPRKMSESSANALIRTKRRKGYQEFEKDELDKIHEDFAKELFMVQLRS